MQLHWPYVTDPIMYGFDPEHITDEGSTNNPFDRQNLGELSHEEHIERYAANLEYIVDHFREELLTAINADKVALTADHATLFGDYGLFKHPTNVPLPVLRRVLWATTSATDTGEFDLEDISKEEKQLDVYREEQLKNLGYL